MFSSGFSSGFRSGFGSRLLAPAIVVVGVLLAAGCSSSDQATDTPTDDAVAASEEDTPSIDSSNDGDGETGDIVPIDPESAEASALAFSQCLRDRGVDAPDITLDDAGELDLGELLASVDPADPSVQQAVLACQGSLEGGLAGSLNQFLESQTFEDALISFSQCVRDDGYDVDDLTFAAVVGATLSGDAGAATGSGQEAIVPILAVAMGLDAEDAAVTATIDGCVSLIRDNLGDLGLGG